VQGLIILLPVLALRDRRYSFVFSQSLFVYFHAASRYRFSKTCFCESCSICN